MRMHISGFEDKQSVFRKFFRNPWIIKCTAGPCYVTICMGVNRFISVQSNARHDRRMGNSVQRNGYSCWSTSIGFDITCEGKMVFQNISTAWGPWPSLTHRVKIVALLWRHNERDSVSNHQRLYCLLKRLFRRRSKITSKLRVTGLCAWNSPVTGELPAQKAGNAENVSIWWRPHGHPIIRATTGILNVRNMLTVVIADVQRNGAFVDWIIS